MKLFLVDTEDGLQVILPESELTEWFGEERFNEIKGNPNNTVLELKYTMKQYNRAQKLRSDEKFCDDFEDEYSYQPSLKDVLEHLYG